MQFRDTVITISRRLVPELDDSSQVQLMVSKTAQVDEICLLPLKELPVNKAAKIKVSKLDTIEPININHPSFVIEAKEYYTQYKTSLAYEKPIKTNDMNTLVHDVNAIFVVFVLIWKFKQSVLPRMAAMVFELKKVLS